MDMFNPKSTKFTQFFSMILLLADHNLLKIRFGREGREQRALNLEGLEIPLGCIPFSFKSSSSASFICNVEILDFGDFNPEMLSWSSAWTLVVVLNGAGGFDGSILWAARSAFMLLGSSVTLLPAIVALACSKNRTWTTTLKGSSSFCAACIQASTDSFLQSRTRHNRFLSLFPISGCA